ncbi:bifunctional UDP-N-acetylglucosamine diphosphorylase/glucosamine-1-phosphate N-acetyltransferase GlmU [Campylobacter sp. MIT 97-5078]|uniref:bifunctional UDP-N-acetylglucosamine diphosphorylase/glucosamine-1-phosphate N-acetyltransferase GlmU n=1 Tax=Campylobacter sp. MIT 97-5078 TaxID=1548153 RepID=UPI0005132148|nr:bifunctional UDP-N-acetylglucosamine diphosphorylase/glucosamine-1-phosphate N-acetyltransferase GlmU [Campylobacter sp. MIT 97-5078]KGI55986.1 bifunctional N-acetylglucosamine-1-phosphate uridyltransferase/glucosamine-1-phosphate acetyltransferase [Campylobacter sp. MIT 97-5078]KGI57448.1 bifunctional N-acetylglucosamine-1-phosphate uridyltransferase/glucosamine-1-phosphate acetyltransferase [Campylobacter sp. MIT 97-5078]KGI57524.1 bifunctional N-acetylglucosamine-1-phosphate uridyltransfer
MSISVVILAAGLGTRMKSNKAKVLQSLSGKAMIFHILKQAFAISDDISVVLFHQKELIKEEICKDFENVRFFTQDLEHYPGTAGALKSYTPKYERLLVLCGDMPLITQKSLEKMRDLKADFGVAVFESKEPKNYGRVVLKNDEVQKIVEFKDASENEKQISICNSGVYVIKSEILAQVLPQISNQNAAKEYYLTDAIALAKSLNASVKACFVDELEFMGVNDKFELSVAETLLQERIKKKLMLQGVIFHNPSSSFISCEAVFKGECEIYEHVRIEGKSVIENSIIKSSSVIEDSVVINSDLGPLAHLRPKCELVNTHIGNFVECKNAKLKGVKAGHLSYLGDCEINEGTNVGCGTITCNYDGLKKHKTIIGKKVFIGSDTQLIAPVEIEDEVIIAAGSSVSGCVPKGALFINRAEKKIVKDFFYKKFGLQ